MRGGRPVPGAAGQPGGVLFVGEAPGRLGAGRTGIPFLGDRSGALFRRALAASGLPAAAVSVTNAVKCVPLDGRGRNRRPRPDEVRACAAHLHRELACLRPRLVVALGDVACRTLLGEPLRRARGGILPGPGGVPVAGLDHPAYVLRRPALAPAYREAWQALAAWWADAAKPSAGTD